MITENISIMRDGLILRGDMTRPDIEKCPVAIIFHGIMADRGSGDGMFSRMTESLVKKGIAVVKFDFDGHGESDGSFSDMSVLSELLDASKIIEYVRSLDFVTDIYIIGHSQGGVVGGMTAGYYRDRVSKLVMLAPAATLKDDAVNGVCFGVKYDTLKVPENICLRNIYGKSYYVGGFYFRTASTLPIYEVTSRFEGKTLIIHGSNDEVVDVIAAKRYKEFMKNAELEIIEGENHGLCAFSLDNVIDRTVDFLCDEQ